MAERLEQDERQPVFMPSKESTPKSDALASRPTEVELSEVSKEVSSQYRKLLTHLGTPLSKVQSLRQNNLANVEEICFEGLVHWLGQNGEEPYSPATWTILLEAIEKGAERKDYAERLRQKLLGGGEVRPEPFDTAHLIPIRHPLESKFIRLFEAVQQLLETSKTPPLDDLKQFCKRLFCRDTSTATVDICRATSYQEVVDILYNRSYWMGYNYIEMLISHYKEPLITIQALVDSYNAELASIVKTRLSEIKKISEPLPDQPRSKAGKNLQKIVFRYNLDADGITLESLVHNVKFLSSRLHIQLELLDVLLGSVALVLSLPTERAVQVWSRVEECWRELWKMRVVWIHLEGEHNRSMDLVQNANAEKIMHISHILSMTNDPLFAMIGFTLYNEYGSQPALQSAVKKYKSAGDPLAEPKASLEWLFHHHVPTESQSHLVDPFTVLGRTVFLAGCNVERMINLLVENHHLKSPAGISALQHWQRLEMTYRRIKPHLDISELLCLLPPEWIQLLNDKYLHRLPSYLKKFSRQEGKDLQPMLHWFSDRIFKFGFKHLLRALISCAVKTEQLKKWITDSGKLQEFREEILEYLESASYSSNEKMSLEKVNEILDYNGPMFRPLPIMHVLGRVQEDVFAPYFQLIANQDGGEKAAEQAMNRLRASVPSEYLRDLEEAFQSVVKKRGEGMALSTGHQSVPGSSTQEQQSGKYGQLQIERLEEVFQLPSPSMKRRGEEIYIASELSTGHQSVPGTRPSTQGQQSAYSSVLETSTAEDLTKVKQKYQLQVSHVIPWLSRADNADKLKQVLLTLTVHSEYPASPLFKEADCECIMNDILQYSAWYESDVLQQVQMKYLANKADEWKTFEQYRRSVLGLISVDKAFPSPLLSLPPLLGYSPMVVNLALSPTWVAMGQVWELKKTICSTLHLQPYSLLLRGYSAGSTNLVFYLASSARVTTERVGMVMMSSDVIIHSMVLGCGTQHEVRYHLDQFLSESAPQPASQP